jgi:branched-chain amino acid aminotransferase
MLDDEKLKELNAQRSSLVIYVNGKFQSAIEPAVSAFDHGLLYGDGVYEAIRKYGSNIFRLDDHLDRLYESARTLRINIPMKKSRFAQIIRETVDRNKLVDSYIRVVVTRGYGKMGVDPRNCIAPTILVMAEPRDPLFSQSPKGIKAKIVSIRRIPRWSLDPKAKTLNYLNQVLAKFEAIESGFEEAIMLNEEGFVSEASTENLFIVRKDKLQTPSLSCGILEGITRRVVIEIATQLKIEVDETNLTPHDLYNADEVFVTGTAAELVPVVDVDGVQIGEGKAGQIFSKIREHFLKLVYGT